VTELSAGRQQRFNSRQGQELLFFATASKPNIRPTHPPIKWVPGLSPGVKRPGREADTHLHLAAWLRTRGIILPLLDTSSWRGAYLITGTTLTFAFTIVSLCHHCPQWLWKPQPPTQWIKNGSLYHMFTQSGRTVSQNRKNGETRPTIFREGLRNITRNPNTVFTEPSPAHNLLPYSFKISSSIILWSSLWYD
jgi:hypothetical protein